MTIKNLKKYWDEIDNKKKKIKNNNLTPSDLVIKMPKNPRDTSFLKELCKGF